MGLTRKEDGHLDQLKALAKALNVFADRDSCDALEFAIEAIEELDEARDTIENLESEIRGLQEGIEEIQSQEG